LEGLFPVFLWVVNSSLSICSKVKPNTHARRLISASAAYGQKKGDAA
jgi:hypothetical protein